MKEARDHPPAAPSDFSPAGPAGLFTALISPETAPLVCHTMVETLSSESISEVVQVAQTMLRTHGPKVTIEITCVQSPRAAACLALLPRSEAIEAKVHMLEPVEAWPFRSDDAEHPLPSLEAPQGNGRLSADPFRMNRALRTAAAEVMRRVVGYPFLLSVRGRDFLPRGDPMVVFCMTEAPLCWSAAAVASAFDACRNTSAPLRIMYDNEIAGVPLIGSLLNFLGGVPSGSVNAQVLLKNGACLCVLWRKGAGGARTEAQRRDSAVFYAARLSLAAQAPLVAAIVSKRKTSEPHPRSAPGSNGSIDRAVAKAMLRARGWLTSLFPCCPTEVIFFPPIAPPRNRSRDPENAVAEIAARLNEILS